MMCKSEILLLWIGLFLFVCTGCSETDISGNNGKASEKELYEAYISINLHTWLEGQSRSGPTGGEQGDGEENAFDYESHIENLIVLFYPGTDLNTSLNTEITAALYIAQEDMLTATSTKVKKVKLGREVYQLIVIANVGDQTVQLEGLTVKEVADRICKQAWNVSGGSYSEFVMTSASESSVDLSVTTTESSPAVADVEIQRIAARVDILPKQEDEGVYTITEGNDKLAQVTVRKAKLINRLVAGSYFLKRVADGINGVPLYLGRETPESGNQTNYVLDPWITLKTKDNLYGGHFDINNGGMGSSSATALFEDCFDSSFSFASEDALKEPLSGKDFYILDYVLENTLQQENQINGYSTGIMYETTYVPLKITSYNSFSLRTEVLENDEVITFFALESNSVVYNSLEAITAGFLENGQTDNFFSHTFTSTNTYQDLYDYARRLNTDDPLGFRIYLNTLIGDNNRNGYLDTTVSWSSFLLSVYGISDSQSLSMNQNGINTKEVLRERGVKTYEQGLCYYTYWIRHSNNNTIESAVMEFGIVRNNIYKLHILSFSALGKTDPYDIEDDPENPDEESVVKVVIYVKPWKLISHEEIVL